MNTKGHPVTHLWWALLVWVAARPTLHKWRGGQPSIADVARRKQVRWEYAQADVQAWDAEPDREGLAEAFALRDSEPEEAVSQLHELAREGSPRANNALGEHYSRGTGVPHDRIEGEKWFKRAFESGSRRGMLNYGKALYFRKDYEAAAAVFGQGADEGWAPALHWFCQAEMRRDHSLKTLLRVRPCLERAAELGSPLSAGMLAVMMLLGFFGLGRMRAGWRQMSKWMLEMDEPPPRTNAAGDTVH